WKDLSKSREQSHRLRHPRAVTVGLRDPPQKCLVKERFNQFPSRVVYAGGIALPHCRQKLIGALFEFSLRKEAVEESPREHASFGLFETFEKFEGKSC